MKIKLIYLYRILLFVLSVIGVYLEITKHGGLGMLMYYTVLSNIIVMIFTGYLVYLMARGREWQSQGVLRYKGAVTMSIMITCVIYHFMLAPIATDFYRLENFLCHYIVPLMFFADTLLVDRARQYRWFDPVLWTSIPLAYMVFALFNGLVLRWPIPGAKDSPFAYFFINVNKYGWAYVGRWVLIIFIAYLLAGFVLYGLKAIRFKGKTEE